VYDFLIRLRHDHILKDVKVFPIPSFPVPLSSPPLRSTYCRRSGVLPPFGKVTVNCSIIIINIIIIIIIVRLVRWWTLPFLRTCSRLVDSTFYDRWLPDQCRLLPDQILALRARLLKFQILRDLPNKVKYKQVVIPIATDGVARSVCRDTNHATPSYSNTPYQASAAIRSETKRRYKLESEHFKHVINVKLECGPMRNLMVALPNIGGALCSTPQSLADAHY